MNNTVQVGDTVQVTAGSRTNAIGTVTWIGETHQNKWTVAHVHCLCGDTFPITIKALKVITLTMKGEDND